MHHQRGPYAPLLPLGPRRNTQTAYRRVHRRRRKMSIPEGIGSAGRISRWRRTASSPDGNEQRERSCTCDPCRCSPLGLMDRVHPCANTSRRGAAWPESMRTHYRSSMAIWGEGARETVRGAGVQRTVWGGHMVGRFGCGVDPMQPRRRCWTMGVGGLIGGVPPKRRRSAQP